MARTYRRDSRGRFAGGGGGGRSGGGGGGKSSGARKSTAGATKAANNATTKRLLDKGLTGIGSRLKRKNAQLYSGTKATRSNRAQLWNNVEGMQRAGAKYQSIGAQRSSARPATSTMRRRGG